MTRDELLQKYRKNNIELACALNEKKVAINQLTDDALNLQANLQKANDRRSMLESELEQRIRENEQLKIQLFNRDHKLATWRAMFMDLFKASTGKYMEIMQTIGLVPTQKSAEEPRTSVSVKKSVDKSYANTESISSSSKRSEQKVDDFSDFVGQPSGNQSSGASTVGPSTECSPPVDKDLIRFSKSPNNEMIKVKIASISSENVTIRRPTKSWPIDTNRSGNEFHAEKPVPTDDADLITQINESLELIQEAVAHPSTLYPNTDIIKNENETTFSDDSITEPFSIMQISIVQAEQSRMDPKKDVPIKPEKAEPVVRKIEMHSVSSSIGSTTTTTPTIRISASQNVPRTIKRKSDESCLRIPKNIPTKNNKTQPSSPKKSKIQQPDAFNSVSPRLSTSLGSLSPRTPSAANISLSTTLTKIIEKSPTVSLMQSTINNRNQQKSSLSSDFKSIKSPQNTTHMKKSQDNTPVKKQTKNAVVVGRKLSSKSKSGGFDDDTDENVFIANHRRPRRAAPTDLREPSLIYKMRRQL